MSKMTASGESPTTIIKEIYIISFHINIIRTLSWHLQTMGPRFCQIKQVDMIGYIKDPLYQKRSQLYILVIKRKKWAIRKRFLTFR